ncbi:Tripartite tricarboxylate transporter family receptor [Pigmentiphaga humi]|uniref:Tripartite tricarboxylate transporter family receptor n=1 Tax=Pigmentiphaga humi TaxID=2478468 RepID=A0A3P4B4M7_9BURK|nr:tripartite tricarboxylate transporter substrate binding protein [Pigmentiphaga humi]VCU71012.1 Tripartite tricarboxylate transporter family receptor [Pigmentiphaga humi]
MASLKFLSAFLALACVLSSIARAETAWTPEQVRIVVPYPPGTEPDVLARDIGNQLGKRTGKVFVVENKPGANAIIGAANVAKSAGDGSVLLMVDRLALVTNPFLYASLPYDWRKELKPVADVGHIDLYVAVRASLGVNDYRGLIAKARSSAGAVNVGTGGNGHVTHLGMAMLANSEGVDFTYVPFKGVAPAVTALLGGEVDVLMAGGLVMSQHLPSGKIKVLAMGADKRSGFMPDVPTLAEAGGKPGAIPSTVFSMFAPGTMSDALAERINGEIRAAMDDAALRANYAKRGVEIRVPAPARPRADMERDSVDYEKLIKKLGITSQ